MSYGYGMSGNPELCKTSQRPAITYGLFQYKPHRYCSLGETAEEGSIVRH